VPARYAGSPMQMDFGELGYDTSVTIVELTPSRPARFREVPLTSMRRLLDVSGTMDELAAHADTVGDSWLRVTLGCERPQPGMAEQVREILPGTIEVRLDYRREDRIDPARPRVRTLSSRQQFERFLTERYGTAPDTTDLDLFDELLDAAQGGAA
jgi:DNA repair protein SbcD/Mre11